MLTDDTATTGITEPVADPTSSRTTLAPRDAWSRSRGPLLLLLLLVLVAFVLALSAGTATLGYLEPEGADPGGARALTHVLADRGVDVQRRVAPEARPDTTVVVPIPELFDPDALSAVIDGLGPTTDLVVVEADSDVIRSLRNDTDLDIRVAGEVDPSRRRPACEAQVAVVAGTARTGGFLYEASGPALRCYAADGNASLVQYDRAGGGRITFVGTGEFMTNKHLDEDGNAALALGLLSGRGSVDWVYPRLDELALGDDQQQSPTDLLPERLLWALLQLTIAVVLLALWRARRLGPVVSEELPVVVRAAEAVVGRARLYEGGGARDRAADVLRRAARDRMARRLGLGADTSREAVCLAIAERTGAHTDALELLLYGGPPGDDAELVRLAAALDSLEREVRTT